MRVITTSSSPRPPASLIDWPMSSKQPCTCSAAVSPCATVPAIHTLWVMLQGEHSSARQSSRPRCESCPRLAQLETSSSDLPTEQHRNRRSSGRTCSAAPRLWRPDGGCALRVASASCLRSVFWGALRSFRTTECGGLTLRKKSFPYERPKPPCAPRQPRTRVEASANSFSGTSLGRS